MLGCYYRHNDLYVFFEPEEIINLGTELVVGSFVNSNHSLGKLEARVVEDLDDLIKVEARKKDATNWESVAISIRGMIYRQFLERKTYEAHVLPGHIFLKDVRNLDLGEEGMYQQLKSIVENKKS